MKRRTKIIIIGSLSVVAIAAFFLPPPSDIARIVRGQEGRYHDIAIMERIMDKNDFSHLPRGFNATRHDYKGGSWVRIVATDSHHGGGTVGVLESDGRRHFYFGHVCGFGEGVPLVLGENRFDPDQRGDLVKIK